MFVIDILMLFREISESEVSLFSMRRLGKERYLLVQKSGRTASRIPQNGLLLD